ncbi:MAG: UDP-N-acetylmuramate dehydrogenase [Patescibacteria group bacterium]
MELSIQESVPLAPLTTIQLGGEAQYFVRCRSREELREALVWANENRVRVHVLGGGSNTVFRDEGFEGLVIKIELRGIDWSKDGRVKIAAGEDWDPFVVQCVQKDWAGVECMSGIPGLVGGTPIQNVAAYGQQVSTVIVEVRTLELESREEKVFQRAECKFGHRASRFKYEDAGKYIVTEVVFQLTPEGKPCLDYPQVREALEKSEEVTLADIRNTVLSLRKKKSMVLDAHDINTRSCGSFFENPLLEEISGVADVVTFDENGRTRVPSAWLIEQVGFPKGFRRGGVGISANHNLALVNYGGTARELLSFADEIVTAVRKNFGVVLKREPVVVD